MDTLSILIGFLVGVIATAIAVELGLKKLFMPPSATKITGSWRLSEIESPLVVCTDAAKPIFPEGAHIVTAGAANPRAFHRRTFRQSDAARANFIVHPDKDRALLFLGPIAPGTMAMSTVDGALCARLRAEHTRLWERASGYVEELALAEAVRRDGVTLRTRGRVIEVVPYRTRHLLRMSDGQQVLGVLVDAPLDLDGKDVVVTGRVSRGTSGYPLLDADEVRLVRPGTGRDRGTETLEPIATGSAGTARAGGGPTADAPAPSRAPGVRTEPMPTPPPTERVLRVTPPAPADASPKGADLDADADPELEFDEGAPPAASAAEAMRSKKARVVLHK